MKARKLLVASALAGTLGIISCKHRVYANSKQPSYPDAPAADAGAGATTDAAGDAAAGDASIGVPPPDEEIHANPKGALYDDGLAKKRGRLE